MTAITISRQLGSLGREICELAGRRLGFEVIWREVINEAARRAGAPEAALAAIDELGLLGMRPSSKELRAYHAAVQQVMLELANRGRVILMGRAGQVILRDHPDVLHIRLVAPTALRVERLAGREGIPLDAARAQVEASDINRKRYVRRNYGVDWSDPELYDLVINTARLSPGAAADLISQAAEELMHSSSTSQKAKPSLE